MGMKIAIIKFDNNKKAEKISYFTNNKKGIGDFISLVNEEFRKNNYNIKLEKVEEGK